MLCFHLVKLSLLWFGASTVGFWTPNFNAGTSYPLVQDLVLHGFKTERRELPAIVPSSGPHGSNSMGQVHHLPEPTEVKVLETALSQEDKGNQVLGDRRQRIEPNTQSL